MVGKTAVELDLVLCLKFCHVVERKRLESGNMSDIEFIIKQP